jgi:hypothetical protein
MSSSWLFRQAFLGSAAALHEIEDAHVLFPLTPLPLSSRRT